MSEAIRQYGDTTINIGAGLSNHPIVDYFDSQMMIQQGEMQSMNPLDYVGIPAIGIRGNSVNIPTFKGGNTFEWRDVYGDNTFNPQQTEGGLVNISWGMMRLDFEVKDDIDKAMRFYKIDQIIKRIRAAKARARFQIIYRALIAAADAATPAQGDLDAILEKIGANIMQEFRRTNANFGRIGTGPDPQGWNNAKCEYAKQIMKAAHIPEALPVAVTNSRAMMGFAEDPFNIDTDLGGTGSKPIAMEMAKMGIHEKCGLMFAEVGDFPQDDLNPDGFKVEGVECMRTNGVDIFRNFVFAPDAVLFGYPEGGDSGVPQAAEMMVYRNDDKAATHIRAKFFGGAQVTVPNKVIEVAAAGILGQIPSRMVGA